MDTQPTSILIPSTEQIATAVVLKLSEMRLVVPSRSLTITQAAEYLQCKEKAVRQLVAQNRLSAGNLSSGTGEKAALRFSVVELERYLVNNK